MGATLSSCNHTSVGVLAVRDGKILAFQRQTWPLKLAPPAGHVDEHPGVPRGTGQLEEAVFATAAVRELEEEVGLTVRVADLRLVFSGRMDNACRRKTVDGDKHWHYWRVYAARIDDRQQPQGNARESKDLAWYTRNELLARGDLEPVWRDILGKIGEP